MATNYLTLDEASAQLNMPRRALSASVASLGLKTARIDRHTCLATSDVARIQAFRTGQEGKGNPMFSGSITYAGAPQPQQMPRNYKNFAKEGYRSEPALYKSINYIITNGAAVPPVLYTDATRKARIEKHPLLDKLETPNAEQTGVDYREALIGYLLIAGNSFQYALRTAKSGPPDELWTLPPDLVHPVTQKPRGIVGYNFDGFDDKDNPILPDLVRHDKFFNPDDPVFGLSPVEAASILVDQNTSARKWNLATLQNSGRMSGVFTSPTPLGINERNDLEKKVNGKYAGPANAGKYAVMDAGMAFTPTAYTPQQLDWLEAIRRNEGGISNILNIPPQLNGDTSASTYNNMEQAKAASYTEEIFPVLDRLYAGWRRWLLPMYGLKGAYLYYDKESVEVVQAVIQAQKEAQFKRAVAAWMSGAITMNEARTLCGLAPIPGGDVFRFGAVLVRTVDLDTYAEQSMTKPAAPPMPTPEPLDEPPAPEPGGNADNTPNAPDNDAGKRIDYAFLAKARKRRLRARGTKVSSSDVTHLLWECMAGACEFCLDNDGEIRAEGEEFPNGVTSPEDCHRFCKCQAYQLSIPDNTDISDMDEDAIVAFFAVGFIASRHDKDVAAQAVQEDDEEDGDSEDNLDYGKASRRARREEYRAFMEAVL